ncbi:hypothetical protein AALB52_17130 [Lachnospiraceae bacterium 38-14]
MVELSEQDIRTNNRQSSKGNQLKWYKNEIWYKADYTGYEGLAEYVVSNLLEWSNLKKGEYIGYNTEEICCGYARYLGCSSTNFLSEGWHLITLERLFQNFYQESLNKSIYLIRDMEDRIRFLTEQTIRITGLRHFGEYISKLLTIDAFFLNEDRHTHNIAVLMDEEEKYHYCPIFDNGAGLLSDTTMDYPLNIALEKLIGRVTSKTFGKDFDEQLDAAEKLYGQHIKFNFGEKDVWVLLEKEKYYSEEIKERVMQVIREQRRKYSYLF